MERQIHISQNLSGEYIVYDGNPKDRRRHCYASLDKFLSSVQEDLRLKPTRSIYVEIDNTYNGQTAELKRGLVLHFKNIIYK